MEFNILIQHFFVSFYFVKNAKSFSIICEDKIRRFIFMVPGEQGTFFVLTKYL